MAPYSTSCAGNFAAVDDDAAAADDDAAAAADGAGAGTAGTDWWPCRRSTRPMTPADRRIRPALPVPTRRRTSCRMGCPGSTGEFFAERYSRPSANKKKTEKGPLILASSEEISRAGVRGEAVSKGANGVGGYERRGALARMYALDHVWEFTAPTPERQKKKGFDEILEHFLRIRH